MEHPQNQATASAQEIALIQPMNDIGKSILREKQLQAVGFNEVEREVIAFTKRAASASKKLKQHLPAAVDDIPIKYRQGAQHAITPGVTVPLGGPTFVVRPSAGRPRYTCGSSISVGNHRDAGSLGCLVRDAAGELFGLSNNHVSASCSYAGIGMPILAPGVIDVAPNSLTPFTVGFHQRALPMVAGSADNVSPADNMDAAIFRIHDPQLVSSFQGNAYDTPTQTVPLTAGLTVEKVGRTTGHTRGVVISQFVGAHAIQYRADIYGFSGIVYFSPMFAVIGVGAEFSTAGDSGSLVVALLPGGERRAVGIVVGGMSDSAAPGGTVSVIARLNLYWLHSVSPS